jgi:hypothetical protein
MAKMTMAVPKLSHIFTQAIVEKALLEKVDSLMPTG